MKSRRRKRRRRWRKLTSRQWKTLRNKNLSLKRNLWKYCYYFISKGTKLIETSIRKVISGD
jgi:hypothetical protein